MDCYAGKMLHGLGTSALANQKKILERLSRLGFRQLDTAMKRVSASSEISGTQIHGSSDIVKNNIP